MATAITGAVSAVAPSIEAAALGQQIQTLLGNLVHNSIDSANAYNSAALAAVQTPAQLAAVMIADAGNRKTLLGKVSSLSGSNSAAFNAALSAVGIAPADLTALIAALGPVFDHTLAATLSTYTEIQTEAAYILAHVPNFARLW